MQEVQLKRTVLISTVLANANTFSSSIYIPFQPDECIVRGISYYNNGGAGAVRILRSNLVYEGVLGMFNESTNISNSKAYFLTPSPINGTYTFSIVDGNGALLNTTGTICIHLEFIKYK